MAFFLMAFLLGGIVPVVLINAEHWRASQLLWIITWHRNLQPVYPIGTPRGSVVYSQDPVGYTWWQSPHWGGEKPGKSHGEFLQGV